MSVGFWKFIDNVSDYDPVRSIGEGRSRWCQVPYGEATCFTWAAPTAGGQLRDQTEWITGIAQWETLFQTLRREDLQDRDMPVQNIPYHKLVELVVRGKAWAIPEFLQGALKAIALSDWERYGDCTLTREFSPKVLRDLPVEPVYAQPDWDYRKIGSKAPSFRTAFVLEY